MDKRNALSHTKIMPAVSPEPRDILPPDSDRRGDTKQYPIAKKRHEAVRTSENPRRTNPGRQTEYPRKARPQQDRVYQPPIRRASYQERLPEQDQSAPNRRRQPYPDMDYEETPVRKPKQLKKRKKHRHGCAYRLITALLTLVLAVFLLYSAASVLAIKQIRYEAPTERSLIPSIAEPDTDVRNILLIGTDSRDQERGRADTMIVLSFSKHNKTLTMTSLLRDSYVSIPDHGPDKLNAAYAYGGAQLLMDTIVNNYGIPIDEYVCVNFRAFVHIADALGGLQITVSDREAEAINVILESEVNGIMGDDPKADFLPSGGTFVLNGKQALSYARIRHVGNADFERTERQRTVLDLMLAKLKHPNPAALPRILHSAMPELTTNISGVNMYLLSLEMPVKLLTYDMQKLRLPADGTFSDSTAPDGQMVLAVNFDQNHELWKHTVTDPLTEAEEPEIEVQP